MIGAIGKAFGIQQVTASVVLVLGDQLAVEEDVTTINYGGIISSDGNFIDTKGKLVGAGKVANGKIHLLPLIRDQIDIH